MKHHLAALFTLVALAATANCISSNGGHDSGAGGARIECSALDEASCLLREDCAPMYSESSPEPFVGCGDIAVTCDPAACGPALGMPSWECPDGSIGGNTGRCLARPDGTCGWEIRECPKHDCD
ncbi:hypothetical protein [Sorangium sp. So ce542]|uniref:hypothetical protein n=1 Tax=Sorangium sp. So ce542 TaxID=3133316 RepID=UPI003F631D36